MDSDHKKNHNEQEMLDKEGWFASGIGAGFFLFLFSLQLIYVIIPIWQGKDKVTHFFQLLPFGPLVAAIFIGQSLNYLLKFFIYALLDLNLLNKKPLEHISKCTALVTGVLVGFIVCAICYLGFILWL